MSELCDECCMQWQPMPQDEGLKELVLELADMLCEYITCTKPGCCPNVSELLSRAWEVEDE